ncbi:MAG: AMP-binding protein [Bacteroidales bacterium]|nr:AMP-binding protein [Bacteroidales bacterium]
MITGSLNKILEKSIKDNWDKNALSDYEGQTLTYGQVAERIAKLHLIFDEFGIKKGDKIALCSKNQVNWAITLLATVTYGAVSVPLLSEFKPSNIQNLVNHSDSRLLFVSQQILESFNDINMEKVEAIYTLSDFNLVYCVDRQHESFVKHLDKAFAAMYPNGFRKEDVNYYEDDPEDNVIISYTSGTTGFAKGVMIPSRSIQSNYVFGDNAEFNIDSNSTVVSILPAAHMYGMMLEVLYEFKVGCHVVFLNRIPSPQVLISVFSTLKPHVIMAVPLVVEKIYKNVVVPMKETMSGPEIKKKLINSFGGRFSQLVIGGAALNREVDEYFRSINFPYTVGYGMTECGPIVTFAPWDKTKLFSCGKIAPGMEMKIDSKDPEKIVGEVLVRGDNVFTGYYKNPSAYKHCFTEDGWMKTGDMGIIDSDGFLYLKGRSKSLILGPSGQNIYPEEIESILNNLPLVGECLVIADKVGITALVYPNYEAKDVRHLDDDVFQQALIQSVMDINKDLPGYSQISKVEIMPEEFEKTPKKNIKRYLYQR